MESDGIAPRKDFFISVKVLASLFQGKFLDGLKKLCEAGALTFPGQIEELKESPTFKRLLTNLYYQEWVLSWIENMKIYIFLK
jgi:hypothetical protein